VAAYHWTYDWVICRLTASRSESAPVVMFLNDKMYRILLSLVSVHCLIGKTVVCLMWHVLCQAQCYFGFEIYFCFCFCFSSVVLFLYYINGVLSSYFLYHLTVALMSVFIPINHFSYSAAQVFCFPGHQIKWMGDWVHNFCPRSNSAMEATKETKFGTKPRG